MASTSREYVVEDKEAKRPAYYVEVTDKQISDFEIWNSLCANEGYEVVVYICEQYLNSGQIPVISSEIISVLFTLASVDEDVNRSLLRKADPLDHGRESLPARSLRLLDTLISHLVSFDHEKFDLYNLELLRCQFFYFIDGLIPTKGRSWICSPPEYNKSNKIIWPFTDNAFMPQSNVPLYASYINLIDDNRVVFKSMMINRLLSQNGSFWNTLSWTLSCFSTEENFVIRSFNERWLSIFNLLFDVYSLRQDYYMRYESSNLRTSPLFKVFWAVDHKYISKGLLEYLFVGCNEKESLYPIPPPPNEAVLGVEHVIHFTYNRSYKLSMSMKLRKKIIGLFLDLFPTLKNDINVDLPRKEDILDILADTMYNDLKIEPFKHFMISCYSNRKDNDDDSMFLPQLVERIINKAFINVNRQKQFAIVDNLHDIAKITSELVQLLKATNKYAAFNRSRSMKRREKIDFCIITVAKLMTTTHSIKKFQDYSSFLSTIKTFAHSSAGLKDLELFFYFK